MRREHRHGSCPGLKSFAHEKIPVDGVPYTDTGTFILYADSKETQDQLDGDQRATVARIRNKFYVS
jgi:hypothetical protein